MLFIGVALLYGKVIASSDARPVPWRDLTAALGPVHWSRFTITIVKTPQKLAKILGIVTPRGERVPVPPPIDYSRREAIVYAVGPRSSTGYGLRVVRITERDDRVDFVVRELTPSLRDRVTAKLTFPYRLVTIPRTDKPIRFALEGRP